MFSGNGSDANALHSDGAPPNPISQPTPSPVAGPAPQPPAEPTMPLPAAPLPPVVPADNSLIDIKRQALQNLTPLINQLEQEPEEKFKTTMMLIQASDNPSLIKQAYEAANQIQDEKIKAQALIDIINEINYFTQQEAKS